MAERSRHDAPVLVIGLGRFGAAAALELRRLGHKVTAIEKDGFLAETFLGRISQVVHLVRDPAGVITSLIRRARQNPDMFGAAHQGVQANNEALWRACIQATLAEHHKPPTSSSQAKPSSTPTKPRPSASPPSSTCPTSPRTTSTE